MGYSAIIVTGDYDVRQRAANDAEAVGYAEQHFNALVTDRIGFEDNPSLAVIGHNGSATSRIWGQQYARIVSGRTGVPDGGCLRTSMYGRGDQNLRYTDMPAIIMEPLYCSDETQSQLIRRKDIHLAMAECLVLSIQRALPGGGLIALSTGHIGQVTVNTRDRGAPIVNSAWFEADMAYKVTLLSYQLLNDGYVSQPNVACPNCAAELSLVLAPMSNN